MTLIQERRQKAEYMRKWRTAHPEYRVYMQAYLREYKAAHRPEILERDRSYHVEHREKYNARMKEYYYKNRNPLLRRAEYHANKELMNQAQREGYAANRVERMQKLRREALARRGLVKELIQQVYEANIKRHGTLTCYLCLKPVAFGEDNLEHKTPIVRGGKNVFENLDVAHAECNLSKGTLMEAEYRAIRK